jgi:hypothetical protein
MPLNGEFVKLMGYLIAVILQLGVYCTLGSNLMNQVNIERLLLFIKVSYSFNCVDRLEESLMLLSATFYAFMISFYPFNISFLFLNFF